MVFCPYCGNQIDISEERCPNCGKFLPGHYGERRCFACGADVLDTTEICPKCGSRVKEHRKEKIPYPRSRSGNEIRGEKSTIVAVILSIVIIGLGSVYARDGTRGLILFTLALIFFVLEFFSSLAHLLSFALWIFAIYDAYKSCQINNRLWYEYQDSQ